LTNSDILYIYDAKLTNPNGDPDEENRPRMDYDTDTNLVTDVRLKRYIRDYMQMHGKDIFVTTVGDKYVTADDRVKALDQQDTEYLLDKWIDVRLFGATMTVKGDNKIFTGPVQFNWGHSLNKVDLLEASLTSHFSSKSGATQGTIGKDYRVKYSLIAFSGIISAKRAEKTKLTEQDIKDMDLAMKEAIPQLATRSKIGQYPRLYLRVEYKDDKTYLGDLRDYVYLEDRENVKDINDVKLNIEKLVEKLKANSSKIKVIHYFEDEAIKLLSNGQETKIEKELGELQLEKIGE
jgi:CRISPR-associated protein Csh2